MAPQSIQRTVLLGANGGFGTLLSRHLAKEGLAVAGIDLHSAPSPQGSYSEYVCSDATRLTPPARSLVRAADCTILCLHEREALQAFPGLVEAAASQSLLLDILSVKTPIVRLMQQARTDVELLSTHPMFAPGLGFQGQNVAVVEVRAGLRAGEFTGLLRRWGAQVRVMSWRGARRPHRRDAGRHSRRPARVRGHTGETRLRPRRGGSPFRRRFIASSWRFWRGCHPPTRPSTGRSSAATRRPRPRGPSSSRAAGSCRPSWKPTIGRPSRGPSGRFTRGWVTAGRLWRGTAPISVPCGPRRKRVAHRARGGRNRVGPLAFLDGFALWPSFSNSRSAKERRQYLAGRSTRPSSWGARGRARTASLTRAGEMGAITGSLWLAMMRRRPSPPPTAA